MTYRELTEMDSDHYKPLTPTHKPIPHWKVADTIRASLRQFSDYSVVSEEYGVSHKGKNCFGAMSLRKDGDKRGDYEMFYGWRHSKS